MFRRGGTSHPIRTAKLSPIQRVRVLRCANGWERRVTYTFCVRVSSWFSADLGVKVITRLYHMLLFDGEVITPLSPILLGCYYVAWQLDMKFVCFIQFCRGMCEEYLIMRKIDGRTYVISTISFNM